MVCGSDKFGVTKTKNGVQTLIGLFLLQVMSQLVRELR